MNNQFLAHIAEDGREQTVEAHCRQSAVYARTVLADAGLPETAYLAGLLHDIGKQTEAFRSYLNKSASGEAVQRGSVNHTFAGARFLLSQYHSCQDPYLKITAEILAFAVGAHHGLFDCVDPEHNFGFNWRLQKPDPVIDEAILNFAGTAWAKEAAEKMPLAAAEIKETLVRINPQTERHFLYGLLVRLVLSAVIEGDRRDTAIFLQDQPTWVQQKGDWQAGIDHFEKYLKGFPHGRLSDVRSEISNQCREASNKPCDIYRLNVPTGGGKTLSSLRFALHHSNKWGKRRIIYVIPLLTIIEQNAAVIREALGDSIPILEHHSNVVEAAPNGETLEPQELLTEAWDAPVLITTQVQFLSTLFSHKTSSIRRFHALVNSIVILDEVQTIPQNMLSLFNQALVFLRDVCHATVILCSATQPQLEKTDRPLPFAPAELIHCDDQILARFKRTEIRNSGSMSLEGIAAFAEEKMQDCQSLLIVCNKKEQAAILYRSLSDTGIPCFHLSTSLCMQHRRDTLNAVEKAKENGKVVLVSTQLIESGVDISFECVIRLQAGMDSIVQAAGRCNRNGESQTPADVYVISCSEENLRKLETIRMGKSATQSLFSSQCDNFDSANSLSLYYQFLYKEHPSGYQDDYCPALQAKLFSLLSRNQDYLNKGSEYLLNQAFKTAAEHFTVFDSNTVDVLVPYGEGEKILADLRSEKAQHNMDFLKKVLESAKPYTISIFSYQKEALLKAQGLEILPCGALALEKEWYDSDTLGFLKEPKSEFWEG